MTDYSKFATARPVNRQAAMTLSARGIHWKPKLKEVEHFAQHDAPPRCMDPRSLSLESQAVIGTSFGRFTVIGALAKENSAGKRLFVVRCQCGGYEERTRKAATNPANSDDSCRECRQLAYIKRRDRELRGK